MRGSATIAGVDAATPAGEAARLILLAKAEPLFALEAAAAGGEDAEAVHDMRVASRRLREALRLFAPLYGRKMARTYYPLVTDVTRTLGRVRDADVFLAAFGRLVRDAGTAERAALAYLVGYRQAERAAELARMRKRLRKLGLAEARPGFEAAAAAAKDGDATRRPLHDLAEEAVTERVAAMYAHLPAALAPERAEAQHAMRIDCKRLRYAVETLAPCFGEGYGDAHSTLVAFQDALGELHDHDVFSEWVASVRDAGEAKTAGVTTAGLDAVLASLAERRARQFARFERLATATPEDAMRSMLLDALLGR